MSATLASTFSQRCAIGENIQVVVVIIVPLFRVGADVAPIFTHKLKLDATIASLQLTPKHRSKAWSSTAQHAKNRCREPVKNIEGLSHLIFFNVIPCDEELQPHHSERYLTSSASMELNVRMRGLSTDLVALVASFAWDLDTASAAGHLEVVQLLLRLRRSSPVRCSFRALNAAAQNGFLSVVRVLHASGIASCSTFAMNMAAVNGHLDVVQFLHFRRSEGCTSYAMDAAAAKGHLGVVKFLHFHRTEGCTTAAMDLAAAQGHLQVVEFLHRYRAEGATVAAIDRAAQNGHLMVVKFFKEVRQQGFTQLAILWASANGHMDVVRYLQPSRDRSNALGVLLGDGRLLVC